MTDTSCNTEGAQRVSRLTLARLVHQLSPGGAQRGREFVRALCRWLDQQRECLRLELVEELGLTDVVATFTMKRDVSLVLTGTIATLPGEYTVHIGEEEFPLVWLRLCEPDLATAYHLCTLDYGRKGQRVEALAAAEAPAIAGHCQVESTHGAERFVRLFPDGESVAVTRPAAEVRFVEGS